MVDLPAIRKQSAKVVSDVGQHAERSNNVEIIVQDKVRIWDLSELTKAFPHSTTDDKESMTADRPIEDCIGTTVFGAFKVADAASRSHHEVVEHNYVQQPHAKSSFIEFVYGSDHSWIRGMHRFEVSSVPPPDDPATKLSDHASRDVLSATDFQHEKEPRSPLSEEKWIAITFSSATLRPLYSDQPLGGSVFSKPLAWFHQVYAGLLFVDAASFVTNSRVKRP